MVFPFYLRWYCCLVCHAGFSRSLESARQGDINILGFVVDGIMAYCDYCVRLVSSSVVQRTHYRLITAKRQKVKKVGCCTEESFAS